MCYSYRDQEAKEEARKETRQKEDRGRRGGRVRDADRRSVTEKERGLVRA